MSLVPLDSSLGEDFISVSADFCRNYPLLKQTQWMPTHNNVSFANKKEHHWCNRSPRPCPFLTACSKLELDSWEPPLPPVTSDGLAELGNSLQSPEVSPPPLSPSLLLAAMACVHRVQVPPDLELSTNFLPPLPPHHPCRHQERSPLCTDYTGLRRDFW